jgi:hypothetical protein
LLYKQNFEQNCPLMSIAQTMTESTANTHHLAAHNLIDIIRIAQHNLAQQHVLESDQGAHMLNTVVALEGLVKVGERRFEVPLVGRMQNARLQIKGGLDFGRTVDCVGRGAGGCEGGTRLTITQRNKDYKFS